MTGLLILIAGPICGGAVGLFITEAHAILPGVWYGLLLACIICATFFDPEEK